MAQANQYKLKVKVNNNEDTRLWRYSSPHDFNGLVSFITNTWNNDDFIAQYEDDEGDLITIASQQDLKDAFDFAIEENKKSLKIFVQNYVKQKRAQKQQEMKNDEQESVPPKQFNSTQEMVLDFLSNKQIITLLPELFGELISSLVERGSNLKVEDIITLIQLTINTQKYKVITSHPIYSKYAVLVIPYIANRIYGQQSLYAHFELNTIKKWITQLIQMLFQVLQQSEATHGCSFKDIVIDIEYPAMTDTGKVIHFGVECDLCGQYPIIGDRYKCSICVDWDCCQECEPKHDHPLIKFKKSSKNHKNASFQGLTEIMQRLSGAQQQQQQCEEKRDGELDIVVDCICGSKMNAVQAKNAYKRCNTVYCDVCSAQFFNEMVYHCPRGYDQVHHKNGYDLCPKCAEKKVAEELVMEQEKEEEVAPEEPPKEVLPEPEPQPEPEPEPEPEVVPEPEPMVEQVMEEEDEEEEEEEDEEEEFEYQAQLVQIKQIMAINQDESDELIKHMLVQHKGDITRVVPLLLQ